MPCTRERCLPACLRENDPRVAETARRRKDGPPLAFVACTCCCCSGVSACSLGMLCCERRKGATGVDVRASHVCAGHGSRARTSKPVSQGQKLHAFARATCNLQVLHLCAREGARDRVAHALDVHASHGDCLVVTTCGGGELMRGTSLLVMTKQCLLAHLPELRCSALSAGPLDQVMT